MEDRYLFHFDQQTNFKLPLAQTEILLPLNQLRNQYCIGGLSWDRVLELEASAVAQQCEFNRSGAEGEILTAACIFRYQKLFMREISLFYFT
jgi:hypothetical protein